MKSLSIVSEPVNATPEALFAIASDFRNAAQRISGIKKLEMLTDGPPGVGTRFRETRVMFGKEATETMEVVEFQPGRSYTLAANSCGCEYRMTVSVRPKGSQSEVAMTFDAHPLNFGAKVMSALTSWMAEGACVKAMKQDLADIKAAAEKPVAA